MEKILSQDEIDALLKGIEEANGNMTTPVPHVKPEVSPYDFANQTRIVRGVMPRVEVSNNLFNRVLRVSKLDFSIPLEISAELGRAKIMISELLQLGEGSVIELNKVVGDPLDIFINEKMIARGEAVVVNSKLGIKVTDILSPIERGK